jgi:hypothetical protein
MRSYSFNAVDDMDGVGSGQLTGARVKAGKIGSSVNLVCRMCQWLTRVLALLPPLFRHGTAR